MSGPRDTGDLLAAIPNKGDVTSFAGFTVTNMGRANRVITVEMLDMLHDCENKLRWVEEACSAFATEGDTIDFLREEAERLLVKVRREADFLTAHYTP